MEKGRGSYSYLELENGNELNETKRGRGGGNWVNNYWHSGKLDSCPHGCKLHMQMRGRENNKNVRSKCAPPFFFFTISPFSIPEFVIMQSCGTLFGIIHFSLYSARYGSSSSGDLYFLLSTYSTMFDGKALRISEISA
jgi:hypothetical protein